MKYLLSQSPVLGPVFQRLYKKIEREKGFSNSHQYWLNRYEIGDNSGGGSYDKLAQFKADTLNDFVSRNNIQAVMELGCGDGNQLRYAEYPSYIGFDISPRAITLCKKLYKQDNSKQFHVLQDDQPIISQSELSMSLDVIFHLVEDATFNRYMNTLFDASTKYVCIYSSNTDNPEFEAFPHVRHRYFSPWIKLNKPEWRLLEKVENPFPYNGNDKESSFADFYFYEKQ